MRCLPFLHLLEVESGDMRGRVVALGGQSRPVMVQSVGSFLLSKNRYLWQIVKAKNKAEGRLGCMIQ